MAKLEKVLSCDLQTALETIESAVMNSVSASLEDASDIAFEGGDALSGYTKDTAPLAATASALILLFWKAAARCTCAP